MINITDTNTVNPNQIILQDSPSEQAHTTLEYNDEDFHEPPTQSSETMEHYSLQEIHHIIQYANTQPSVPLHKNTLDDYINNHYSLMVQVEPFSSYQKSTNQQIDSGANTNVTNDKRILQQFRYIQSVPINGIDGTGPACNITGEGFLNLQTDSGDFLKIKMHYAPKCSGTIISPNAIVTDHPTLTSWSQHAHVKDGKSIIHFYNKNEYHKKHTLTLSKKNNLWFIQQSYLATVNAAKTNKYQQYTISDDVHPTIHLTNEASYELWHQRLMHPGHHIMQHLPACVDGTPHKFTKHQFHHCDSCTEAKITIRKNHNSIDKPATHAGEQYHMDFGFVSATNDSNIIRSHDNFKAYLLIVDNKTRYTWAFLSKNKQPPLKTLRLFLQQNGIKTGQRIIRTDQGGELAASHAFQDLAAEFGYAIEITGADNSSQNGVAERPHRTLANMVRATLTDAGLPDKFWSDALVHAVFIKNRLPHAAFQYLSTPFTELTGTRPNLQQLKIFGTPIITRKPGKRRVKMDRHCYHGIFLRFAKTMKNIVYYDKQTKRVKTTTYAVFDEAHYSNAKKPPGAQRLLSFTQQTQESIGQSDLTPTIKIANKQHTNSDASSLTIIPHDPSVYIPKMATHTAAGYDLHANHDCVLTPNEIEIIDTGIAIIPPKGTYARIASRSGLALQKIETKAGVIDPDYTGTIKIILHNFGTTEFHIQKGDRIAQMILERYKHPKTIINNKIPHTQRGHNGFGSTGIRANTATYDGHTIQPPNLDLIFKTPENTLQLDISLQTNHTTLGFKLRNSKEGVLIVDCEKSTPSAKLPQWRRRVIHGYIRKLDNHVINTTKDFTTAIKQLKEQKNKSAAITIATETAVDIHPDTGIPQLNFDQLGQLDSILNDISNDLHPISTNAAPPLDNSVQVNKLKKSNLTRSKLRQQDDWNEWIASEKLQLDLYEQQNMFSAPTSLPEDMTGVNVLPMIWTYLVKSCGRKKARCVANGAPHLKGSITLANTYAACLEQNGARIFWAVSAIQNKKVYGSDASNAFAEAPPPKAPLYLKVDQAYIDWYQNKTGITLSNDTYVKVQHAIQGHPEAPRLWQDHIDQILKRIGFTATTQEPCVYIHKSKKFNEDIYLLRQVDDFAIACSNAQVAEHFWNLIDSHLKAKLKREGLLKRHNGIDIEQTKYTLKIHCQTYLNKILKSKSTLLGLPATSNKPIPMKCDNAYHHQLDTAIGPDNPKDAEALEKQMGFKYRAATGELIFAMVTCRPDISNAVLKLTQFNNKPAAIHYKAILDVYRYLQQTIDKGIQYWRSTPDKTLPDITPDGPEEEQYNITRVPEHSNLSTAYGYVDSDWAGNVTTRKSLSGICLMLGNATVIYKTIHQKAIALSSTEAEFYALSEAGKLTLYLRSILDELRIPQQHATVLYEDNQGCLFMTASGKPTKRTRHVDIRHFAILDWVEHDILNIKKISTSDNTADCLTKPTGRTLFYRHTDTMLGRRAPVK